MKKVFILTSLGLALLGATINATTSTAQAATKTTINKKSSSYKNGYAYGKSVATFDKEVLNQSDSKFHDGTAWNKNYSAGYYAGYASVSK